MAGGPAIVVPISSRRQRTRSAPPPPLRRSQRSLFNCRPTRPTGASTRRHARPRSPRSRLVTTLIPRPGPCQRHRRPPRTVPAGGSRATTTACVVAWCANAIDASPLLHAAAFRVTLQHPPAGCTSCAGSQPAPCTIRRWPVGQAVAATVPWPATAFRAHAPPTPQPGC